jgi:hypothetical protein
MNLKVVNKSAYNTIQSALCTIPCIMLINCNAYAKVYEVKSMKKDSSNSYRSYVAILQFFFTKTKMKMENEYPISYIKHLIQLQNNSWNGFALTTTKHPMTNV